MIEVKTGELTQDGKTQFIFTIKHNGFAAFDYLPPKKLTLDEYFQVVLNSTNDSVFEIFNLSTEYGVTIDGVAFSPADCRCMME